MSRTDALRAAFLTALPSELRPMFEAWPDLGPALAGIADEGRRNVAGVSLADDDFAGYLAERVAPAGERPELPAHAADLYLAWACARGDVAALAQFDRSVLDRTNRVLVRLGLRSADAEDVKQELRARLLLPTDGAPPRLLSYQGTGPLVSWACAVAGRQALALLRRQKPDIELDEEILAASDDPFLSVLRERNRREFKTAFQAAFAELEPRDRAVLRALLVDERTVGDIAAVFGIHRVTASRWISRIRQSLLTGTRTRLRASLGLDEADLDSAIRLVDSQLDLSLYRLLAG